jgi:hypothetical protein
MVWDRMLYRPPQRRHTSDTRSIVHPNCMCQLREDAVYIIFDDCGLIYRHYVKPMVRNLEQV